MKKKIITFALTMFIFPIIAGANTTDIYYTNIKDVNFTEEEYTYLLDNLGENFVMLASEDLVNQALNDINSIEVLEPDGGIMPLADGELYFFPFGVKTGERKYVFSIATSWTKMPSVRSFDVLGIYWGTSNFTITEFEATQRTMNAGFVNYNRNGTNTKETSLGIATSMNLINDASTYNLDLDIDGEFSSSGTYKINFAYLHSTTPINLSQSHSFTFSQSGLGGVAYYSSASLRNQFEVKSASYTITV